jgi:transposase
MDIAKDVFQLHGVNAHGTVCFRKRLSRSGLLAFTQQLPTCEIAMESCSGSHYWGRELEKQGHRVKLLPAQHVKPFVHNGNKDDRIDAEAICEAAGRSAIKAVPIKSHDQLDLQAIHRHRQQLVKQATMLSNQIRGFLGEYGIVIPQGVKRLPERVPAVLGDTTNGLSGIMRDLLRELFDDFRTTRDRLAKTDADLARFCKSNEDCRRALAVPGAGVLTTTAVYAAIGNGRQFKNGRAAAAWVGLVPSHIGTGGKTRVGFLSRKGNRYLKVLLIRGGQAVMRHTSRRTDKRSKRLEDLRVRSTTNVAAVASAHRTMRVMWAVLSSGKEYREAA